MSIEIRPAIVADAPKLTALMHASSAYAGDYATILEGYAVTPDQIERDVVYLAETASGEIVGFYSLTLIDEPELDLMFVADHVQGEKLGSRLFTHMRAEAKRLRVVAVKIVSHPPSVEFYRRMGAIEVGTKAATAKARWQRPILSLDI